MGGNLLELALTKADDSPNTRIEALSVRLSPTTNGYTHTFSSSSEICHYHDPRHIAAPATRKRGPNVQLGIQLIVFGPDPAEDLGRRFALAHDSGFRAIECGPLAYENHEPSEFLALLTTHSLHLSAIHSGIDLLANERTFNDLLADAKALNCPTLIFSGILNGGLVPAHYLQTASLLSERLQTAQRHSIDLAYHHHDFEFLTQFNDKPAIDLLLCNVPPALSLVIDTYWLHAANRALRDVWPTHGARCRTIHLKDGDHHNRTFAPLGEGLSDPATELTFAATCNLEYIVYEQDDPGDREVEEAVRISGRGLTNRCRKQGENK